MGKRVAVVGGGAEGMTALRYWRAQGADVALLDASPDTPVPPDVTPVLGGHYLDNLEAYDLIVRSPGVPPHKLTTKKPITSVTQEFFDRCPAQIIGVTGTKGKGTTATLVAKIIGESGRRVWLGGNIGTPALDFLDKVRASHIVVLELSSFQLIDLQRSPHIGVCLMIAPEHLDWHESMREYVAAKGNIFWHQRKEDLAVYNAGNEFSTRIAQLSPGRQIPFLHQPGAHVVAGRIIIDDVDICAANEVGLVGPHNLENICAAITATWDLIGHRPEPIQRAVKAFSGLPHRLERVARVDGVEYINDSFAANQESTVAAIRSFTGPKVLIVGGYDRGLEYDVLAEAVAQGDVRRVILIGQTASKISALFDGLGYRTYEPGGGSMAELVNQARRNAEPGDTVILSPGCASFDMFKNFNDRGDQFRAAVKAMKERA